MSLIPFEDFFFPSQRPVYRTRYPLTHYHYNTPAVPDRLISSALNDAFGQLQQLERQLGQLQQEESSTGGDGKNYSFKCNVAGYLPEELNVDLQGDELVIQGEHKQEGDGQSLHRTFLRRVTLPESVHRETIQCNIDDQGRLEVRAERKVQDQKPKVSIPIGFKSAADKALNNGTAAAEKMDGVQNSQ